LTIQLTPRMDIEPSHVSNILDKIAGEVGKAEQTMGDPRRQ